MEWHVAKQLLTSWGPLVVSAVAVLIGFLSWRSASQSARAAVRSAGASETSAEQAKRSADVAVGTYKLQLRPHVIAVVTIKRVVAGSQGQMRDVNAVCLMNRGTGMAYEIAAKLKIALVGEGSGNPHEFEVSALHPGDAEDVGPGPVPSSGRLEVWGRVRFSNAEGEIRELECVRGKRIWREVAGGVSHGQEASSCPTDS